MRFRPVATSFFLCRQARCFIIPKGRIGARQSGFCACPRGASLFFALLFSLLPLVLVSCAGRENTWISPTAVLELNGPPLALVGAYGGVRFEGSMDRTCMVGYGALALHAVERPRDFCCTATIDAPPTAKGRVRGVMRCTGSRQAAFSFRNMGPDQGVGIAKENGSEEIMVFFYHPFLEEARRRFPQVRADVENARKQRQT